MSGEQRQTTDAEVVAEGASFRAEASVANVRHFMARREWGRALEFIDEAESALARVRRFIEETVEAQP